MAEYYTKAEADQLFAASGHNHNIEEIGGTELPADRVSVPSSVSASFGNASTMDEALSSVASQFTGKAPSTHTHAQSDVTGLESRLTNIEADITALQNSGDSPVTPMVVASMHLGKLDNNSGAEVTSTSRICSDPFTVENGKSYWQVNDKAVNMYVLLYDADEMFLQYLGNFASGAEIAVNNANAAYMRISSLVGEYDLTNEFRIYDVDPASGGAAEEGFTQADADLLYATISHTHTGYATADHTHTAAAVGAATTDHTHSGYATTDHTHTGYAVSNHTHTAADVGAASSTHTHTAADVGAATADHTHTGYAASSHTHTASDIGAASSSHTHTASDVGAAAYNHTHTASDVGAAASNHTHDGYAASEHTHAGYAAATHTHSDYLTEDEAVDAFAPINHTHSGYAASEHTHTGFASSDHTHTGYAASDHTHTSYASTDHTHTSSDVGAAAASHTHAAADITETFAGETVNTICAEFTGDGVGSNFFSLTQGTLNPQNIVSLSVFVYFSDFPVFTSRDDVIEPRAFNSLPIRNESGDLVMSGYISQFGKLVIYTHADLGSYTVKAICKYTT